MARKVYWTDERICNDLLEISKKYGGTMPSKSQIYEATNSLALYSAIACRGGLGVYAKKTGLPYYSSKNFGTGIEEKVCEDLILRGFEAKTIPNNYAYDIIVGKAVKVEVKASKLRKKKKVFEFSFDEPYPRYDIAICCCIDNNGNIISKYYIPACLISGRQTVEINERKCEFSDYRGRLQELEMRVEHEKRSLENFTNSI